MSNQPQRSPDPGVGSEAAGQPPKPDPDLLAAVVLHTLVSRGTGGMTLAEVAVACERDPADPADVGEIEAALEILRADQLADRSRRGQLWLPTRPAIRAAELSF